MKTILSEITLYYFYTMNITSDSINTASRAGGCILINKAVYLPMRVKTATPRASIPIIILGIANPSSERPKRRKNSMEHQPARELGMFILHSPFECFLLSTLDSSNI